MPMLHGCAFPGCTTFTLSTYCIEHELLDRALRESERTHHEADVVLTAAVEDETPELEPLGS